MTDYRTMPNPALQPRRPAKQANAPAQNTRQTSHHPPNQRAMNQQRPAHRASQAKRKQFPRWLLLIPLVLVIVILGMMTLSVLALRLSYADRILPQVQVGMVSVGNLSPERAAQKLTSEWGRLILVADGQRYNTDAESMGMVLDAEATAAKAFAQGHGEGGMQALFQTVTITPVVRLDESTLRAELARLNQQIGTEPINAGVAIENGQVIATPAQVGQAIDIDASILALFSNPNALTDNTIQLIMRDVPPDVPDSSALVAQAQQLLSNPLNIAIFDPVTGQLSNVPIPPQQWGAWLTATPDPNSAIGLSLRANAGQVAAAVESIASNLQDATLDSDTATDTIQRAIAQGETSITLIKKHLPRTHVVRAGETLSSIGWDYGVPHLYLQERNGGIESLSVGQAITIPALDAFLELPVVPNKRIIVDISDQRTRVYENGQLKWDWASSTGIASSPTWTGIYQILSHETNAYASNWNLYMPNFMGVYKPVPGSDFTNGFHGFPTRGGGQLLWENSLGRRVTYGCILLSDVNVRQLYQWAEEGVIVEIRP